MGATDATGRRAASTPGAKEAERGQAVRNFLRSLNILLKSVRLYGFDHSRTASQLKTAWDDLYSCLKDNESLRLGVSGQVLLVDGNAIHATSVEHSFAALLADAGISSIFFFANATEEDFGHFARCFSTAGPKLEGLARKLRQVLGERNATIRVNDVRFVEEKADGAASAADAPPAADQQKTLTETQRLHELEEENRRLKQMLGQQAAKS